MQQQPKYDWKPNRQSQKRGPLGRAFLWFLIILAVVLAVFFTARALRDSQVAQEIKAYEDIFADNIYIDGINISGMTPQEAYKAVFIKQQESVGAWRADLVYNGHHYVTVDYHTLGLETNLDSINQTLKAAWDLTHSGNSYQKKAAIDKLKTEAYQSSTIQNSEFKSALLEEYLDTIANYLESMSKPSDAYLIRFDPNLPDPFVIQQEQFGYKLNVKTTTQQILERASQGISGTFELQPEIIRPSMTESMLRMNMRLRSIAQTEISASSEFNRTQNIIVSSGKISGTVLKPGSEFSFNRTAQERTLKNGYYEALEQVYGYLETGVGGGVCQTSTTIYQAALLANLHITKREPHQEPVLYTDPGLDATVYLTRDREIDFRFKNNTNHDLYLSVRVKSGASSRKQIVEVKMYGEPFEEGVRYKLKSIKTETLYPPATPEYVNDKKGLYTSYKDEEVQKVSSKEGSVYETYLQKYVNNQLADEKLVGKSRYPARREQIWRGVKDWI